MIEFPTHKNLLLVVSQSKIGPEMGYLAWAGIGPKLSHYWARKRIQNVPKVIQKRHNRHPHPKIPHISRITEQNWS